MGMNGRQTGGVMSNRKHTLRWIFIAAVALAAVSGGTSAALGKTDTSTRGTWGSFGPVTFGDMAFSPSGELFVSDCGNARIYTVSRSGVVSVFAGSGPGGF